MNTKKKISIKNREEKEICYNLKIKDKFMTEEFIIVNGKKYYTYATISEANDYFATCFNSEWSEVSASEKISLLITATRLIDKKCYQGKKVDEEQHLKFPRIIADEQTDDELVMEACCELAMSLYFDGDSSSIKGINMKSVQSVSLGDSSISFKDGANLESDQDAIIDDYLSDYLMGGVQVIL